MSFLIGKKDELHNAFEMDFVGNILDVLEMG
jgi:hypothetical protein